MAQARSSKNRKMDSGCAQGIVTVIRALLSVLLLILAYSINASTFAAILMIAVSAILSGFDIALAAIENILKKRDYLNNQLLICLCAVAGFCIGCYIEAVIMLAIYQLGRTFLNFIIRKTKQGFYSAVSVEDREGSLRLRSILSSPAGAESSIMVKYLPYFELFSKAAFIVGVLFAAAAPPYHRYDIRHEHSSRKHAYSCICTDIGIGGASHIFACRAKPFGRIRCVC